MPIIYAIDLWELGVQILLESDTELFTEGLEIVEVLLVLARVFDFGFDPCGGGRGVSGVFGGEERG